MEVYRLCHVSKNFYWGLLCWKKKSESWWEAKYYIEDTHPTIVLKDVEEKLSALICEGTYDEIVVKNKVGRIEVYDIYILVKGYDGTIIKVFLW